MIPIVSSFIFTLVIIWLIARPLLRGAEVHDEIELSQKSRAMLDEKERCQQMLRDLELDFATKKLSEEEYAAMKSHTQDELSKIEPR